MSEQKTIQKKKNIPVCSDEKEQHPRTYIQWRKIESEKDLPEEHKWIGSDKYGTMSDLVLITATTKEVALGKRVGAGNDYLVIPTYFMNGKPTAIIPKFYDTITAWAPLPTPFQGEIK